MKLLILMIMLAPAASEADKLIDRGVDLREQGKDQEALELFQKAYEMGKSPRALAQIGLADQALGRWVEADDSLEKALAEKKDKWIEPRRKALESSLAKVREHIGRIEILGAPGASVSINGKPAGTLPLDKPAKVIAGTITVEVSREDSISVTRTVNVPAGGLARETIELAAKKKTEPAKIAVETPPVAPASTTKDATKVTTTPAPAEGGVPLSTIGFITGGVAVAAAATGTAFLFMRNSHIEKYNDDSVCLAGGRTRDENCKPELDSANTAGTIMAIGFIGSAVLAGATAALFVLDDSGSPAVESKPVAFHVSVAPDGIGAVCSGSF